MKLALQLYTIRDCCQTGSQLINSLKEVKKLGYDGVEFAGYAGLTAPEMKRALADTGLTVVATHENVDRLESNLDEIITYCLGIGCSNIVCAYSPTKTVADLERLERVLKAAQDRARAYGIKVLYHNHSHEFLTGGGTRPIDEIKRYSLLELDTYWAFNSKVDVPAFIAEHKDRIGLIHLKDGSLDGVPCAIGEGKNDIQAIIDAAKSIDASWLIVENDNPTPDGLSDVGRSMKNLRSIYTL